VADHTSARVAFERAIEHGNLVVAEITARELGRLDLSDALELTALIALRDRVRGNRAAMRWLRWWIGSREPTLDETALVVGTLAALGGPAHAAAVQALRALVAQPLLRRNPSRARNPGEG
jgi:hypothetical protein